MDPKYPIYIVSRGRWESRQTAKAFEKINVPYYIAIDPDEFDQYAAVIPEDQILIIPPRYKEEYDPFDNLGLSKSKGPGYARNFCWDHSIKNGFERHWVFDDNVSEFYRLNNNLKIRVNDGTIFRVMEDFCDRYINIAIAGPNYDFFAPKNQTIYPMVLNTRIYSMLLIMNTIPFRWRGRYNEDTDLSLRVLKKGWCTVQFNAFLGRKAVTQSLKGGNTKEFYAKEGTFPKSRMQVAMHPDVSRLVWKYGRWHHYVNYRPFRRNKLIMKEGIVVSSDIDNYNMEIIRKSQKDEK